MVRPQTLALRSTVREARRELSVRYQRLKWLRCFAGVVNVQHNCRKISIILSDFCAIIAHFMLNVIESMSLPAFLSNSVPIVGDSRYEIK